eukprot:7187-Heterococcus_DN1.PRE.4
MGRKKSSKKREMTLIPHRTPNLSTLLDRAQVGDSAQAVKDYLAAGGSPMASVVLPTVTGVKLNVLLPQAITFNNEHPHKEFAECIELLVAAGADLNATYNNINGVDCALMCAADERCCSQQLAVLLQHGANPNIWMNSPSRYRTPLHLAADVGLAANCQALLEHGCTADVKDDAGRSALAYAANKGHLEVVRVLHKHGANINTVDKRSDTPLLVAASRADAQLAQYLVSNNADVNAVAACSLAPLAVAVQANCVPAVQLLLDNGADLHNKDVMGQTALFTATIYGNVNLMKLLVQHGSDLFAVDMYGRTLLMVAATEGHASAAEWLISKGLSVHTTDRGGMTALHYAAQKGHSSVGELLRGKKEHKVDSLHRAALHLAAINGHNQCTEILIAAGAVVLEMDNIGKSALHYAVQYEHCDAVKLLLNHGAAAVVDIPVFEPCTFGCCFCTTALKMCKQPAIVKLLLAAGADVHDTTPSGSTSLHVAAAHGYPAPVICLLIKAGADLHAVNSEGKTAAEVAHNRGNDMIAALLNRAARAYSGAIAVVSAANAVAAVKSLASYVYVHTFMLSSNGTVMPLLTDVMHVYRLHVQLDAVMHLSANGGGFKTKSKDVYVATMHMQKQLTRDQMRCVIV